MTAPTLLTLPSELQAHIYTFVLVGPHGVRPEFRSSAKEIDRKTEVLGRKEAKQTLQLLQTCRKIYKIAKPIYYTSNTFIFSDREIIGSVYKVVPSEPPKFVNFRSSALGIFTTAIGRDTLKLCRDVKLKIESHKLHPEGQEGLLCCRPYFSIDFKTGAVATNACDTCRGTPISEYREEILPGLERILKNAEERRTTRNWPADLAKHLERFVLYTEYPEYNVEIED